MNAPLIELIIRSANASVSTLTVFLLLAAMRVPVEQRMHPLPLLSFLFWVMVITAVWRWFVLWLGLQKDLGPYNDLAYWVQPMGASITFLLYLALALIAYYHVKVREGRHG